MYVVHMLRALVEEGRLGLRPSAGGGWALTVPTALDAAREQLRAGPLPAGLRVSGVVLADHVKCLDWRSRRAEYVDEAPEEVVAEVVRRLGLLLGGDTA